MIRKSEVRLFAVVCNCTDGMLWYADRIGEMFELYAPYTGGALDREDGWRVWLNPGVNFIRLKDAEIVPTRDGKRLHREELDHA